MREDDDHEATGRFPEASRRTYFASERTLLAWWRTGMAAAALALGVGGLVPRLADLPKERFLALGAGYGFLAIVCVAGGTIRERGVRRALANGAFPMLSGWVVTVLSVYICVLVLLTVIAYF